MTFLLGLLTNTWVKRLGLYAVCIGAIFMSGFFFKGSCDKKKELKEAVDTLQDVIVKKDRVRRHYENLPKSTIADMERILSGRVSLVCGKAPRKGTSPSLSTTRGSKAKSRRFR